MRIKKSLTMEDYNKSIILRMWKSCDDNNDNQLQARQKNKNNDKNLENFSTYSSLPSFSHIVRRTSIKSKGTEQKCHNKRFRKFNCSNPFSSSIKISSLRLPASSNFKGFKTLYTLLIASILLLHFEIGASDEHDHLVCLDYEYNLF